MSQHCMKCYKALSDKYRYAFCKACSERMFNPMYHDGPYPEAPGKCDNCNTNKATEWYAEYADFNRGGYLTPWCRPCIILKLREKAVELNKHISDYSDKEYAPSSPE